MLMPESKYYLTIKSISIISLRHNCRLIIIPIGGLERVIIVPLYSVALNQSETTLFYLIYF